MAARASAAYGRHVITPAVRRLPAGAALLLTVCCAHHECSGVGAQAGVTVDAPEQTNGLLTVCAGSDCGTLHLDAPTRFVELPLVASRAQGLTVTYAGSGAPVVSHLQAKPRTFSPNGGDCDPHVARIRVTIDKTGRATTATS
jgi:hypothetical protein